MPPKEVFNQDRYNPTSCLQTQSINQNKSVVNCWLFNTLWRLNTLLWEKRNILWKITLPWTNWSSNLTMARAGEGRWGQVRAGSKGRYQESVTGDLTACGQRAIRSFTSGCSAEGWGLWWRVRPAPLASTDWPPLHTRLHPPSYFYPLPLGAGKPGIAKHCIEDMSTSAQSHILVFASIETWLCF